MSEQAGDKIKVTFRNQDPRFPGDIVEGTIVAIDGEKASVGFPDGKTYEFKRSMRDDGRRFVSQPPIGGMAHFNITSEEKAESAEE